MKRTDATQMRWERMRPEEQLALAAVIACRHAGKLRKRFPGVTGVGAGLRTKAGKLRRKTPVCLLFSVQSGQKKRFRVKEERAIPRSILVRITRRGRREGFRIPTDVVDMTRKRR